MTFDEYCKEHASWIRVHAPSSDEIIDHYLDYCKDTWATDENTNNKNTKDNSIAAIDEYARVCDEVNVLETEVEHWKKACLGEYNDGVALTEENTKQAERIVELEQLLTGNGWFSQVIQKYDVARIEADMTISEQQAEIELYKEKINIDADATQVLAALRKETRELVEAGNRYRDDVNDFKKRFAYYS